MSDLKKESSNIHFLRQCFITAGVAVNIIGHGCVIGFSAILIPSLRLPESHIKATPSEESWIASIIGFALIMGNIIITPLIDNLGRKRSHILTTLPILTGWILLLLVNSVPGLIIARCLQGISMGMLGPLGSVIIGEMTDPKKRGAFLTCISLSLTIGVLFTHTIGTILSWQQTALVCAFTSFTSLCLIIHAPESPPWLTSKGRYDESREVFKWLRGTGKEQDNELEKMIQAQRMARKSSVAGQTLSLMTKVRRFCRYFGDTIKKPEFYKPIIIMAHMYTMFQFSGINVLSSYMMDILKQLIGPDAQSYWMVALDIERLIANILAVYLMKTMKRRTLLFSTGSLCILSYVGKAAYLFGKTNNMLPFDSQLIPTILIILYMFSLSVGISSIAFAISGEIFPLEYRGLGGGISVLALSLNFFVAVKCFPVLTFAVGLSVTYLIYAAVVVYCLTVVWFILPETKDRTLQEIEDEFRGKISLEEAKSMESLKSNEVEYTLSRRYSSQIIIH